jgi:2-polyprenyl-6-methoxyphenol hydroxylase-like FAD-dependent oxidoreductase
MTRSRDLEVVVVGGGPVGLVAALLLARAGLTIAVIEKSAAIENDLRASTFHPPTLDLLDRLDCTQALLSQGVITPQWQVRLHPEGDRAVFDLAAIAGETRHPYRLQCEQWKLSEAVLTALAREQRAEVLFGAEVIDVTQDADKVSLTLAGASAPDALRASFVIGADGAHSIVRERLGIPFEGQTYPETTLLATTTFPFHEHLDGLSNVSYCWKAGGNFSLLRVPDRWRVSIYPREDLPLEEQTTTHAIEASLQEIVSNPSGFDVMETRPYRVHKRIVPHYYRGRVALAGDAAHLNSPAGGMGLNGGVHDAFELAAALLDIKAGAAHGKRFALYERRRRPVALEQILAQADANRARMREKDPDKRREILAALKGITADRAHLKDYLLRTSMITGLRQSASVM